MSLEGGSTCAFPGLMILAILWSQLRRTMPRSRRDAALLFWSRPTDVEWYEHQGSEVDHAASTFCRIRRARRARSGGPQHGDEAVRDVLAAASPEALSGLPAARSRTWTRMGFPTLSRRGSRTPSWGRESRVYRSLRQRSSATGTSAPAARYGARGPARSVRLARWWGRSRCARAPCGHRAYFALGSRRVAGERGEPVEHVRRRWVGPVLQLR